MAREEPSAARPILAGVLRGFGLAPTRRVRRLHAGAGSSAKFVIERDDAAGAPALFLKRRSRSDAAIAEALAQHGVRARLIAEGLPVHQPMRTREGGTLLLAPDGAYELTPFVDADRWSVGPARAHAAGAALARIHAALQAVGPEVTRDLRRTDPPPARARPGVSPDDGTEAGFLLGTIADAAGRIDPGLLAPRQVVHGDFHPGNTRWAGDRLVAVLDFDACRVASALEEAALASLHFSLDRKAGSMASRSPWPDPSILEAFWSGYRGVPGAARAVPWIAASAFARETLAGIRGESFDPDTVSFATGVVAWLVDHAEGIGEILARLADAGPSVVPPPEPERG